MTGVHQTIFGFIILFNFGVFFCSSVKRNVEKEVQCSIPGICIGGSLVGASLVIDEQGCIDNCREDIDCKWYTYSPGAATLNNCIKFDSCRNTSVEDCPSCLSGQRECLEPVEPVCNLPVSCQGHVIEMISGIKSFRQCYKECQKEKSCNWMTYYENLEKCFLLSDCPSFAFNQTDTCITSERRCNSPTSPICYSTQCCQGTVIESYLFYSIQKCLEKCHDNPECSWISLQSETRKCQLLSDCQVQVAGNCQSAQTECRVYGQGLHILVATGVGSNQTVEIVSLDPDDTTHCDVSAQNFPYDLHGAVGYLHNGVDPMVCGGFSDQLLSYRSGCYVLEASRMWSQATGLLDTVAYSASSPTRNGWLLTGGFNSNSNIQNFVDLLQDDLWQHLDSTVPLPLFLHCMVNIGSDKFLVIGGQLRDKSFSSETFVFDANSKTWTQGPQLKFGRRSHSCSIAVHQGKQFVVVAGGESENQIDFVSVELIEVSWTGSILSDWIPGPKLPRPIAGAILIHNHATGSPLLVGGQDTIETTALDKIYQLSFDESRWIELPQKLKQGRYLHVAFLLQGHWLDC